ncbi:MAG: DUF4269 domain-containing protein [Cyclobacteriaceae bacterium]|jgi:hypothetical protein|nr:DUF4269 domain-containing protein [Cyclobacteriaceae bacterium]
MSRHFHDLTYLLHGSLLQQSGFHAIQNIKVLEILHEYNPFLAGTLPLDIFIEGSDLDIICYAKELEYFAELVTRSFNHYADFSISKSIINKTNTVIATFHAHGFRFELFGQPVLIEDQMAYRHLIKEYEILKTKGTEFKKQVIALKQCGVKTEVAFAQLLSLSGDPYEALLAYQL